VRPCRHSTVVIVRQRSTKRRSRRAAGTSDGSASERDMLRQRALSSVLSDADIGDVPAPALRAVAAGGGGARSFGAPGGAAAGAGHLSRQTAELRGWALDESSDESGGARV
jgi:hypothetical protein